MLREARGVLKSTIDNRVQPDYHFIHIVLLCFFQPEPCVPWQAMLKSKSAHFGHCRQAKVRRTYLIQFNSYSCSFIKTNLRKINYKGYQKSQGFVGNNYLAY